MENQIPDIKLLYENFIKNYNKDIETKWEELSANFKDFWENKILNGAKEDLTDDEIDKIVRILDAKGKGNTKNSLSVANARVPQDKWRKMFRDIKSDDDLKSLLYSIFKEQDEKRLIEHIDELYIKNQNKKNYLTGKSGNIINDLLFIYNPKKHISIISLDDRKKIIECFHFKNGPDFKKDSVGKKIVVSNKAIIDGFKEILDDLEFSPRSISDFLYSEPIKSYWRQSNKSAQKEEKTSNDSEDKINKIFKENEEILKKIISWYKNCSGEENKRKERHKKHEENIKDLITPEIIENLDDSEFKKRFEKYFKEGGGYYNNVGNQANINKIFKQEVQKVKVAILYLMDERTPVDKRIDDVSANGEKHLLGFGPAIATCILMDLYPEKYSIYNNVTDEALKVLLGEEKFKIIFGRKSIYNSLKGKEYINFLKILNKINSIDTTLDYIDIDYLFYLLTSEKGKTALKEIKEGKDPCISIKNENTTQNKVYNSLKIKNIILHGPVGTGKTYFANKIAKKIVHNEIHSLDDIEKIINSSSESIDLDKEDPKSEEEERIVKVTFHKSYSYEDFIIGIKAETKDGKISYDVKPGRFKQLCDKASLNKDKNYVLIIDEINRGDISRIFGELITLIEEDKRGEKNKITLPYNKENSNEPEELVVPENLYIIGTMNDSDKSISLVDIALRRRFTFILVGFNENVLRNWLNGIREQENIIRFIKDVNERISAYKGSLDFQIGHAFFRSLKEYNDSDKEKEVVNIFKNKIFPLLEEYFYNDMDVLVEKILNNKFYERKEIKLDDQPYSYFVIKNEIFENFNNFLNELSGNKKSENESTSMEKENKS